MSDICNWASDGFGREMCSLMHQRCTVFDSHCLYSQTAVSAEAMTVLVSLLTWGAVYMRAVLGQRFDIATQSKNCLKEHWI